MPYLHLDWSDGRYSTRPLTDEEAAKYEANGGDDMVYLEDRLYDAYSRYCEQDSMWQAFWRAISNEQSMRRREKELMPLEDAERKIDSLKEELASAKRMEKFYEEHYMKNLADRDRDRHRKEYVEYTCVYPQPGCKIDALPSEWQDRAQEILEKYRPDLMEDGLKYQGCCCSYGNHQLIDAAEAGKLRGAGFLVENDTEVV